MAGPAPTELIHRTDQDTEELHTGLGNELKVINQPTETIPPHERPVLDDNNLKDLGQTVAYGVQSNLEEFLEGKDKDTDVRVTPGSRLKGWVLSRIGRKKV